MSTAYILVEGPTDAEFLRRLLPKDALRDAQIIVAAGSSGIPSLARSLLVRRKTPLAVVMDAGSADPEVIEERRQSTEELIRAAAGSTPVLVIAAVPEIEAWLFAAPRAIERVLGHPVPTEFVTLGKRDPKGVLRQLTETHQAAWDFKRAVDLLEPHDLEAIRALPEVAALTKFLKQVQPDEKAA